MIDGPRVYAGKPVDGPIPKPSGGGMRWEYRGEWAETSEAAKLISDGWEPFAVTYHLGNRMWFRRSVAYHWRDGPATASVDQETGAVRVG